MKKLLLVLLVLTGLISCSKKDVAPAPALQMTVRKNGKVVVFPISTASLVLSKQGTNLVLTATLADHTSFSFFVVETSGTSFGTPRSYSAASTYQSSSGALSLGSVYAEFVPTTYTNACGNVLTGNTVVTYQTYNKKVTGPDIFLLDVRTVDRVAHTMSGTFSGFYFDNKGCDTLEISDGQFTLPYTVNP